MLSKINTIKKLPVLITILLLLGSSFMAGCNGKDEVEPTNDAQMVLTNVAETLSAMMTETFAAEPTATQEPSPTASLTATITPTITLRPTTASSGSSVVSTITTSSCDQAGFVSDVTIPDGTDFEPGVKFTKTWLLSNEGTCTWNSSYNLVFYSGSQMDGPDSQKILDTNAYVYPDGTLEISVDLIAPLDKGTYTGYWILQNASSLNFAIGTAGSPFYVQIDVGSSATATPTPTGTSSAETATQTSTTAASASTGTATQTTVANTSIPTLNTEPPTETPVPSEIPTETPLPSEVPTETPLPSETPTETLVPTEDTGGG